MGKRGPSAQYSYGITIEAGNYNEVINGFEKRLKDLDKVTKTTTATFAALSEAMKSGKQVDFSKAEGQLTGLVAEMEEVAKWREQLAGGQKLSDMFDGFEQVKQSLGQVTGQLDKFGDNIEEIFSILQNVPQNTSKTFVDIRKVLSQTASDMNKIIAELNNPTEKTDVSGLKNQLSSLATDFVNEWNKAAAQGIKMDRVVDFKPFANIIKTAISGARSLGVEFNDVSASVTEATKNVVALYSVKHPTGMFKDMVTGLSNVGAQSKKAEQTVVKFSSAFKAAISIADKFSKSDMGLAKKSKEMDEFLAKLKNPEITIDLKNKDINEEFTKLEDIYDNIVGDNDITSGFLKNLPIDKLKELGTTLQNIIAIGKSFPDILDIDESDDMSILDDYGSDLKKIIKEIKTQLDDANAQIAESVKTLKSQLDALGLKDIELDVKLVDLTGDKVQEYVNQLNQFVDDLTGQLKNKGAIELPVNIQMPGITPDNANSKKAKDIIKDAMDEYSNVASDVASSEQQINDSRSKAMSKIISGAFGSNENLDLYLSYIKKQFSKIKETVRQQKREIQDMLSLDFTWNKGEASNSFSNLFVELQDYFADPENAIKVEIDSTYLKDGIKNAFKDAGGIDVKLPSSGTPMDQSQLAATIIAAFRGSIPTGRQSFVSATRQATTSSNVSPVTEADVKSRFVFNIKEFMSKYSNELSDGLNQTLENIVNSVKDIAKTANGSKVNQEVRAKIQAAFGSLDLSKVAEMTNEEIISWVQNALLKADESGKAVGADLPDVLKRTKVSWKSISSFSNALNQLFIKIENETRDAEDAIKDKQKVAVLKDFGYRARAIDSKSAVVRKLGKGEADTEFLKSQMERLQSVKAYKDSLGEEGSKIVKWLDNAIAIYQKLINISNGTTTFDTEAKKQEEITKLREELSKIRVSDDKQLIETLAGEITVSKKYKNGTKGRGQRKEFNGSSRGLEKALSLIEKAGDDGVITIRFTSTPNDKAFKEWIESENEYGKTINTRGRLKDNNVRGESKSSLTSPREDRKRLLDQKIDFKPFSQSRKPIDWDEYESDLQRRLQENEDALVEQQKIVDEARKNLTSAKRNNSSVSRKVYIGAGEIDSNPIDKIEDILKAADEDKKSLVSSKSVKQLSKMVKSSYLKDAKSFKKVYEKAESDLNELMSKEASEDNVAQVKSILNFIENLNRAAANYSSAAKYVDENFVIDEKIDTSLFERASKRVSDAGEIKKNKKYQGAKIPQSNVSELVYGIKRKEGIDKLPDMESVYENQVKYLLDNALTDLNEAIRGKDTPANRKKIQGILQYIDELKAQFDQFKEIERKIYEIYDFGKNKPKIDTEFEGLSSVESIIEIYKTRKEILQNKIKEIDEQLEALGKQKGNIKHYTDEQKYLAKLQLDASNYYSGVSKAKQLEYNFNNAKTEQEKATFAQLLQSTKSQNTEDASKNIDNVIKFIEELENKLSNKNISKQDRNMLSSVLQEAQRLFKELNTANVTGKTPLFQMSQSRYEDIMADNIAEVERIAEEEKNALARRAKVVEELNDLETSSLGAEALRRASAVKSGEDYRRKSTSAQMSEVSAKSVLSEAEERLHSLEKEKEMLQAEKEKEAEKKKYNNLLIQEKQLKDEIAVADKAGVSTEEKKVELRNLQEKIARQEKKLGIKFEEVSPSMTKDKAFNMASEYDAQEKLLRSQIKALESKVESAQELINSLTARGFNSAKGEAEVRRFTNDRVADFRSSDYFREKKDEIRDKYLKGVYKEDGTLDSSDSLEGKIRELADKYSKDIDKIFFNIADVKEGNAQEFLNTLVGDQTRFSNAFKGNNDVGQKFMADYEELKSFYWELIKEEENNVVDDYRKSIKVDKHNGTVSYTSYDGDTIQEVVVDLKSQIIQRLKEQIEAELKPVLSEKSSLLDKVSDSKKQALEFAGLKESDLRNTDLDNEISSRKSKILGLQNTDLSKINIDIEEIATRNAKNLRSTIEDIDNINGKIADNIKDQAKLENKLNELKKAYTKEIHKDGVKSDAGRVALERLKANATAEYTNSNDYKSQVEAINNKYYGKGENGSSLFDDRIGKIIPKYKDAIYRILSETSKYTEEEINGFIKLIQDNPELYSDSEAYLKLGKTKNKEMAKTLSDNSERVWSNLVREYSSVKSSVEDQIERDIKALIKSYRDSFEIDNDNNTVSYTSYTNGKAKSITKQLKRALVSAINQEVVDILSGKNIESIVNDLVGDTAGGLYNKHNSATHLQDQLERLTTEKGLIESRISSKTLSEEDQKDLAVLLAKKKAKEEEIAVVEEEIKALEFVKKAREEARELDRKTDQEREATELSKIERYEQGITEKKEKQKKLQEELNLLRGEEVKDVDAIERKESELEEVTNKITELEGKKQKSEGKLGRIRERIENAPVVSEAGSSSGGILSPIVNLLTEIRDILSKISGIPTKSGGDTSGSSPSSGGKTKSEINSMLSKYWQKKNGKPVTQEEWKQLKQDYVDGKLTDLDEVLAQEVQAKIEKEKKEDTKPVTKNVDTKKSDDRFSNILRLAGFRDENNKAIQLASKSTDEFLSDAQALYDEVKNWSGDKTSDEYLAKQLRLGKTLTALRSSLPRTYSGKNGYTKAEEWANYLSENGLSGAMESSIKNQKNLKAVIENGVAVVTEEVVEQGVEEGKKVVIESQSKSTSKKQKYASGLSWSKTKDAIKNGANKPEDGLSLEEYITKAQSLYNEINSWVGEKNIEYFSKRLELGSIMQKAAVAVKQANPDKKFKNTDLYNYFAKQYNMENVNSLALTATKLDGNKEIMAALADVKPVDTTPVTQAVKNADNAVVEHVAETAGAVGEEVKSKKKIVSIENLKDLLLSDPSKVLEIAKSDPERVRRELFGVIQATAEDESVQEYLYGMNGKTKVIDNLGSTNAAKIIASFITSIDPSAEYRSGGAVQGKFTNELYGQHGEDMVFWKRLGLPSIQSGESFNSFSEALKNLSTLQEIFDTVYPNDLNKIDFSKINLPELKPYLEAVIKDFVFSYLQGVGMIQRGSNPENGYPENVGYGKQVQQYSLSSMLKFIKGASEEDIAKAMGNPELLQELGEGWSIHGTKEYREKYSSKLDSIVQNIISAFEIPGLNAPLDLNSQDQSLVQETAEDGVKKIVQKATESAQQAISQGVEETELSDAEKLKLAKKELQNRIDTAKGIAQEGTKSKSKEVIKSGSIPSVQNPEYVFNEGVESTSEFVKEVWNLTEAFKAGANAANVEYGFATQNGKRIQLAKGDNGYVDFQRFYGDVDSLTHSHSYTKDLNNMVFSLEDINQLKQLGTRNNLKKYNLIYDNEMMSLNLGKNSQEAAEAIADCYPQINDVVMAMLSREDGNSIPAENSDEMARILNGYLQKVVEDAGGRLSVVNSKGENATSKYSITDDEYSKLNNILAKSQNYYNDNLGTVSKSDYVSVIRQYIAEEFGKEFMANVRAKSDANPHGGVYTEFSAIPEYDDEDKKMLDYAEQVTLYSKKIVAAEKAFVESLQKMSNEDLMAFIKQGEETLGIKKEPEVKPTLTKAQQEALNPNNNSAQVKSSINEFKRTIGWDSKNIESITNKLGTDALSEYNEKLKELRSIAGDIGEKGKQGIIIENADLERLDRANKEVRELQANLIKIYNKKVLEDDGRLFGSEVDRSKTSDNISTRGMLEGYAKQFVASSNSSYDFSNFDIINKKLEFTTTNAQGNITKAVMQWNDSLGAVVLTTDKEYAKLDSVSQKISDIDTLIAKIKSKNFLTDSDTTEYASKMEAYKQAVKEVEDYDPKNAAGITLEQKLKELEEAKEALVKAGQDVLDKGKNAYGYNAAQKVSAREADVNTLLGSNFGKSAESSAAVEKYRNALKELNDEIEAVKSSGKAWSDDEGIQSKLKMLADNAIKAEKELLGVVDASKKLDENRIDTDAEDGIGGNVSVFKNVDSRNANEAKAAMMAYAKSIKGVQLETIKYNDAQKQVTFSVRTGKNEMTDMVVSANQLTNAFSKLNNGSRHIKTGMEEFLSSVGSKFKEVGRYLLSFGSFYRVWSEIQKGVTYVREIDSALTELKKVTDETDETYAQFLKTMSQTGAEVGATVKDLTNMAANWARLGYSIQEAGELAKSTAVLLNVSEFTDADTASEALISTMQAYGYAAEDSMHVVDVLNEIGNNFAISSDGIATALQDSASSLMAAGNNLEQSVAMIAAAIFYGCSYRNI